MPTATSVRAVPAKLLIDNRVVINNHLARSRGGKVSFTHLIGYAMVKAPRDHARDEQRLHREGRQARTRPAGPRQLRPRHRPAEGRRLAHPRRALDQVGRGDGLRPLLDRLRGHGQEGPQQQADRRGLPGHDDLADEPRWHRHRALGPPSDEGPGHDHRRRRPRLPGRVAGREHRDAQPQRREQDPHAHLDLRPPDHPGRARAATSCGSCSSCSSATTASTTRSSSRCASRTSRSAGSRTSTRRTTTTSTRSLACRS